MLGCDLAVARAAEEPHLRLSDGELLDDRIRTIFRTVRGHDDLQALARVVEREQILETTADHVLLVVRGDDQRDGGRHVFTPDRPRPETREYPDGGRVPGMGPGKGAEGPPEERLSDHAARSSRTSARYRSMATTRSASSST